jgi:hypothetical protein
MLLSTKTHRSAPVNSRSVSRSLLLIALSGVALTGCTAVAAAGHSTPHPVGSRTGSGSIVDPLSELTDPDSQVFQAKKITPLLHVRATGPQDFTIARPASSATQVQFYVACAPDTHFTITMGTFYSAPCSYRFLNSGAIPSSATAGTGDLSVKVTIPKGVEYWLVAIPYRKS